MINTEPQSASTRDDARKQKQLQKHPRGGLHLDNIELFP